MYNDYPVYNHDMQVGRVQIKKEGLYYCFDGDFQLQEHKIWRIVATSEQCKIDLGICLFDGSLFTLNKRVPTKRFTGDQWRFDAVCPQEHNVMPVCEDAPFEALDQVENAVLETDAQQNGLVLNTDH